MVVRIRAAWQVVLGQQADVIRGCAACRASRHHAAASWSPSAALLQVLVNFSDCQQTAYKYKNHETLSTQSVALLPESSLFYQ